MERRSARGAGDAEMKVTYWSDYACPYCYIGETRMHNAIEALGQDGDRITLEMKSFELNPEAAKEYTGPTIDRFARKYGLTREQAEQRVEGISELGRAEGLDFRYATTRHSNTRDAHRLTKLAQALGNDAFEELCYKAYFTDNLVLSDHGVLREIAKEAGLPEADVARVLESNEYEDAVIADELQAQQLGVQGVPFFVIDDKYAIAGCFPTDQMEQALRQALNESIQEGTAQGASCGINGCGDCHGR